MRLLRFGAKNLLGYRELALELTGLGPLVLVDGKNYDFAAVSANGAGKSTLSEAISYALFGHTIRNQEAKHGKDSVVRYGSKGGAVAWAEAELPAGLLRVERYRQHPEYQNKVRAWLNGEDVVRGRTAADTDARIEHLLGFNYDLFKRAVVIHSRLTESFSTLENRYIKQITERLLGLRDFDGLRKFVGEQAAKCEATVAKAQHGVASAKDQLERANEELEQLIEKQKEHARLVKEQRAKVAAEVQRCELRLDQLNMERQVEANRAAKLKIDLQASERTASTTQQEYEQANQAKAASDSRVAELSTELRIISTQEKRYSNLEGKECPECGQAVSPGHIKLKKTELAKRADQLATKLEKTQSAGAETAKELRKLQALIESSDKGLAKQRAAVHEAEQKAAVLAEQYAAEARQLRQLKAQKDKLAANPYAELVVSKRTTVARLEEKEARHRTELKAQEEHKRYLDFWSFAFGPSGVRSFMLDGATPMLNKLANFYLEQLTDNTMSVSLSTVKPNKDGTYRDYFDIDVTNECGGSAIGQSSDGELACIDIAMNLAISDLLDARVPGGIGLLFLDQIVDLVDPARAALAIRLLRQKTNPQWCTGNFMPKDHIFLITHRDEIRDQIGDRIVAEKRDGICQLVVGHA